MDKKQDCEWCYLGLRDFLILWTKHLIKKITGRLINIKPTVAALGSFNSWLYSKVCFPLLLIDWLSYGPHNSIIQKHWRPHCALTHTAKQWVHYNVTQIDCLPSRLETSISQVPPNVTCLVLSVLLGDQTAQPTWNWCTDFVCLAADPEELTVCSNLIWLSAHSRFWFFSLVKWLVREREAEDGHDEAEVIWIALRRREAVFLWNVKMTSCSFVISFS